MELEKAISKLKYELDKSKIVKKYQGKPEELFDDLDEYIKSIETVLKELDVLKFKYQARKDRTDTIITKQEKMIELMVEKYNDDFGDIGDFCQHEYCSEDYNCKECIKQYFEKKAEENK